VATSQLQPWQALSCGVAMFPFELLRLPRFVHRSRVVSATTGGYTLTLCDFGATQSAKAPASKIGT